MDDNSAKRLLSDIIYHEEKARKKQEILNEIINIEKYYSGAKKKEWKKSKNEYVNKCLKDALIVLLITVISVVVILAIGSLINNADGFIGDLYDLYKVLVEYVMIPIIILCGGWQFLEELVESGRYEPWSLKKKEWKQYLEENPELAKLGHEYYINKKSVEPLQQDIKEERDKAMENRHKVGLSYNESANGVLEKMNHGYTLNQARVAFYGDVQRASREAEENRRRMEEESEIRRNFNEQMDGLRKAIQDSDRNADERYRDAVYRKKIDDIINRRR